MASIEKRVRGGNDRWYARYRDPSGKQLVKVFDRKKDATDFLIGIEGTKLVGSYIDPTLSKVTVGVWATRWIDGQAHLKPSTRARYEGIIRGHIEPKWQNVPLVDVAHADVQSWISALSAQRSPATVRKVHRVLSLILALAVKDGRLVRNAAAGVNLPRVVIGERRYLTHEQVRALATECATPPPTASKHAPKVEHWNSQYRLVVLFLAYTGVRFGEMAALRVGRVDFLRRRATIAESVTLVRGRQVWGTPKGHDRRQVPVPSFLIGLLAEHVRGKSTDDLVFTAAKGGALRAQGFQRSVLTGAAARIGVPGLHPHELRHTAASLAIASGADVKVVQQMLGHKSAVMTLDLYGHLFDDRLDDVAERLDQAARAADVYPSCTDAEVVNLRTVRELPRPPRNRGV